MVVKVISNSSRSSSSTCFFSISSKTRVFLRYGCTYDITGYRPDARKHPPRACYKIESLTLTKPLNPVVECDDSQHEKKPEIMELEKMGMLKVKPILEDNVRDLYGSIKPDGPDCVNFADLGCSLGPSMDTTSPLPEIAKSIYDDLAKNNLNNMSLVSRPCFVPKSSYGSFHGRLFPDNSIHFLHSSYHLNWLSQVPKRLVREMNKGNICVAKESPICVYGAYSNQFENDLFHFLRSRSHEIVRGGRIVMSLMGTNHNKAPNIWERLGTTLNDMMMEGLIEESTLDSFNIPFYAPCYEEMRVGIMKEGSFKIKENNVIKINWNGDFYDKSRFMNRRELRGKSAIMTLRMAGEAILRDCLGDEITKDLFHRHCKEVPNYLKTEEGLWTNHIISLIKE